MRDRAAGLRAFEHLRSRLCSAPSPFMSAELRSWRPPSRSSAFSQAWRIFRSHDDDPGLTTDIGLLIAPLLGGLAMSDSGLASGLGVAVAVTFAAKAALHGFVKGTLTSEELSDGLVFAIATLIIWPQLPDRYLGPLQALNPTCFGCLSSSCSPLGPAAMSRHERSALAMACRSRVLLPASSPARQRSARWPDAR